MLWVKEIRILRFNKSKILEKKRRGEVRIMDVDYEIGKVIVILTGLAFVIFIILMENA